MFTRPHPAANLCGLVLALVPVVATAAPLPPGGSVSFDTVADLPLPPGERLAQKVIPFTLQYPLRPGTTSQPPATTAGTLTTSVYRGTGGDGLVFVYDLDVPADDGFYVAELSDLTLGSFAGFATDVTGRLKGHEYFSAGRSADGATIRSDSGNGIGGAPVLVVATNATAFDDGGTAHYLAGAEFVVTDPANDEIRQETIDASVNLTGLYQPVAVPEPTAVALLTAGALLVRRNRR
jgi:hypothetical protein